MEQKLLYYLQKNQLTESFPSPVLSQIHIKFLSKGEYLCYAGCRLDCFFMIMDGKAKVVSLSQDGNQAIIARLQNCDMVGDIEYYSNCLSIHSVIADTNLVILVIPLGIFDHFLKGWAPFLNCLCTSIAQKLCYASMREASQLLDSMENQLLKCLFNLPGARDTRVVSFSRVETAQQLGITERHLRRLISNLEEAGLLQRSGALVHLLCDFP